MKKKLIVSLFLSAGLIFAHMATAQTAPSFWLQTSNNLRPINSNNGIQNIKTPCTGSSFYQSNAVGVLQCGTPSSGGGSFSINTSTANDLLLYVSPAKASSSDGLTFASSSFLLTAPSGTFSGNVTIGTTTVPSNGLLMIGTSTPAFAVFNNGRSGFGISTAGTSFVTIRAAQAVAGVPSGNLALDVSDDSNNANNTATVLSVYCDRCAPGDAIARFGSSQQIDQFVIRAAQAIQNIQGFVAGDLQLGTGGASDNKIGTAQSGQQFIQIYNGGNINYQCGNFGAHCSHNFITDFVERMRVAQNGNVVMNDQATDTTAFAPLTVNGKSAETATSTLFLLGTTFLTGANQSGTFIGANPTSGYNGDFVNFQVSSATQYKVTKNGFQTIYGTSTISLGGGLLTAGNCTSTATIVNVALSTSTDVVYATPQTYPGDGDIWLAFIDATGATTSSVTVKDCAIVTVTPSASRYNFVIQRSNGQ